MKITSQADIASDGIKIQAYLPRSEVIGMTEEAATLAIVQGVVAEAVKRIIEERYAYIVGEVNMQAITNLVLQGVALEVQKRCLTSKN